MSFLVKQKEVKQVNVQAGNPMGLVITQLNEYPDFVPEQVIEASGTQ
jgi:hypothetical protein